MRQLTLHTPSCTLSHTLSLTPSYTTAHATPPHPTTPHLSHSRNSKYSIATVLVIGFFADPDGVEEDEFEDFLEVASDFRTKEDVYFAVGET